MADKVKVYGKAQNRTALGVVHAYARMHPALTLDELRNAIPDSVCPDSGVKQLFLPVAEAKGFNEKMSLYFVKPGETVTLADGTVVAMAQVWSKASLERLADTVSAYCIALADPDKSVADGAGFRIELLDGYQYPKPKKGCLGVLLALIMIGAATGTVLAMSL